MHKLSIILFLYCLLPAGAQDFRQPFDFPILLSGNFGELRDNHFHSGIDFKTQGAEGKAVHAVQEGYVSRIGVSPWGYGNVLYLDHPDGTTTVYAHLQRFAPPIAAYVKAKQYEEEGFRVDFPLTPEQFPVKQGEIIAYSGNTGSSAGPHLHFEVRDTKSEEVIDPIPFFRKEMTDTRPPRIQEILITPMDGEGVVNGSTQKLARKATATHEGHYTLSDTIQAWGKLGLAVKAYDYMDNTGNIYGIREITLRQDGQVVYHSDLGRFAFSDTRFLNSYVDYEEWKRHRSFYIRSFVEPGNRLPFIESHDRGFLTIDKEKTYHLSYLLSDLFGNTAELSIRIQGKKQPTPEADTEGREPFYWFADNRFGAKGIRLLIPKGNLYDNFYFHYAAQPDSTALAATHILHDRPIPLHRSARLSLRLQQDTLANKQQYGIVRLQKERCSWIGGTYREGWIDADIRELGGYTVAQDTEAPAITPIGKQNWNSRQRIRFRLSDNLSGIQSYRGEIDGQYALFEMNNRSVITYRFDRDRLSKGKHLLKLTVRDAAGNEAEYAHTFVW